MSRRRAATARVIVPDAKYGSYLISKFINYVMREGKKALAEKIVYSALDRMQSKYSVDPFESFNTAISNVKPQMKVTSVRVGGANYQVPGMVGEKEATALSFRWILAAALKRSEKTMIERLAAELFEAANNRGGAMQTRENTHKTAESNRAFAHLAKHSNAGR
ncbi:30S ribosomal protein S7 [Rickettsiales endosymbiont of Paramecium tredecaurelia]|uniref:30S ribosomal protein S7 n=1 Tax=Candidatus Sarmatiella mevalonica TaxID=2770581 RepID=UPI001920D548|nr:30S ribosomal protein S7 [Candidatus Sarmatiella mevalonica]MBL3284386.1 30S ribosomal protein S7 [Candidatus Sarmatiella mevalonica]